MSGPVQVLVLGFEEQQHFSGELLRELVRLREANVVRLVDVLLVHRDEDGTFETLPLPEGLDPRLDRELGQVAADILGGAGEPLADGEAWSLGDVVEPGSVAAVALIEHLWAGPLVEAIATAGGHPLGELWLSAEDRARLPD